MTSRRALLALRIALALLIGGQVALAIGLWSGLPDNIPVDFDFDGRPAGWAPRDYEWFVTSGLLALVGAVAGYLLPLVAKRLAENNSTLLSVPDRAKFQALPLAARVRAMAPLGGWLLIIGAELQLLTAFLMTGTWLVGRGHWQALPPVPLYGAFAVLLGTAIGLAVDSSRAVRREIAAAQVG